MQEVSLDGAGPSLVAPPRDERPHHRRARPTRLGGVPSMSFVHEWIPSIEVNIKTRGILILLVSGLMVVVALLDPDFFNSAQVFVPSPHHEQLFIVLALIDGVLLFVKNLRHQYRIIEVMLIVLGLMFIGSMAYQA